MKTWTLIDLSPDTTADIHRDACLLSATELGLPGCSVSLKTLRGGLRDGVELLTIDNGRFRVGLLPQRGMNLWKAWLGDWAIGWDSPARGPVHPRFVPVFDPGGLGWLEGFDELLSRCGLLSNGAPQFDARGTLEYPLHGRIANLPAHRLVVQSDSESGELAVTGVVDECRFHFHKLRLTSTLRTCPGEPGVRLTDEVTNLSASPGEMQLLYHTNFGPPLLEPGSRIIAPVRRMMPRDAAAARGLDEWDRFGEPHPGGEQCYYFQLLAEPDHRSRVLLRNAAGDRGVNLRFSTAELPCFTLWKNPPPRQDGYVTGLEPGTNFPNVRSFEAEHGRVRRLTPGETVRFEFAIEAHGDRASVAQAESAIERLQQLAPAEICSDPAPDWTRAGS
ncbi:MAG TPA: aldose 1-epimerase family protein [Pirellulales bacterium]|nr:aldose 1-epimerase family protein [Pirellulales bacterium]